MYGGYLRDRSLAIGIMVRWVTVQSVGRAGCDTGARDIKRVYIYHRDQFDVDGAYSFCAIVLWFYLPESKEALQVESLQQLLGFSLIFLFELQD